jgi:secreted protein with Ig-like and vWFA domain
MRRQLLLSMLTLLSLAPAAALQAQEMFPDVEYVAGKDGFADKAKGTLILGGEELRFVNKDGNLIFAVPVATITEVTQDVQVRDASVGKKLLFGGLAGSRKQEFVQITSESATTAEGIVFKVKQGTSVNVVAKIKFAIKRAGTGSKPAAAPDSAHR